MESQIDPNTIIQCGRFVLPYVFNKLSALIEDKKQDSSKVSKAIEGHLIEVVNWAKNIQMYGMGVPQSIENATIPLDLYTEPRRFQSAIDPTATKYETDLLSDPHNVLLLGEPGSGKTTTFKRIAITMLKEGPINENDILQYPMVIRLRELNDNESLFNKIADLFGLVPEPHEVIVHHWERDNKGRPIQVETKHTEMQIGDERVENVIPKFLNEGQVLLLLDGLDELRSSHRAKLGDEIVNLGRRLTTSKIIASCRTGDYTKQMDGFAVLEICPLSKDQILAIIERWLGPDDKDFENSLKKLPYYDVADRPLLLTQLLFIYKRYGYFPDQPSHIYQRLVSLLLEEWDAQRGIKRTSKYSGFNPRRKSEFLSSLAYRLTYSLEKTRFKEEDLVNAYLAMCNRFHLPKEEAIQVAQEIQTHTGIILLGPKDTYEFCHLSLQEYLSAEYIVRAPLETLSTQYLAKYSAPLAIAVALSSSPSSWFGNLILNFGNLSNFDEAMMSSFLSRVLIEYPIFELSDHLGFAMLLLYKHYRQSPQVIKYLDRMLEIDSVLGSIAAALKWYSPKYRVSTSYPFIQVIPRKNLVKVYKYDLPIEGFFPARILPKLQELRKDKLFTDS